MIQLPHCMPTSCIWTSHSPPHYFMPLWRQTNLSHFSGCLFDFFIVLSKVHLGTYIGASIWIGTPHYISWTKAPIPLPFFPSAPPFLQFSIFLLLLECFLPIVSFTSIVFLLCYLPLKFCVLESLHSSINMAS